MTAHSPYIYSTGPNCAKQSAAAAAFALSLSGLPASLAGPATSSETRRIAVVYPGDPNDSVCEQEFARDFGKYGAGRFMPFVYSFDMASYMSQTASIVERLKSAGITTVFLNSDLLFPAFFMNAAKQAGYFPEWVLLPFFSNAGRDADAWGTLPPQDEMEHAFSIGIADRSYATEEAYKVFEMGCRLPPATSCDNPLPPFSMGLAYSTVLMIYSGLQAAGPWLTPTNFARGLASLPGGPTSGMFGAWKFTAGSTSPAASFQVLRWYSDRVSPLNSADIPGTPVTPINNGRGVFLACNGAKQYLYAKPNIPRGQPACP